MKKNKFNQLLLKKSVEIGKALANLKGVKIVMLEGSIALGYGDKDSDIDLVVLSNRFPSLTEIKNKLHDFTQGIKVTQSNIAWLQIQFMYKNSEVNVGFGKYEDFRKDVKEINKNPKNPLFFIYKKHILNWILNTKIIFDRDNILKIRGKVKLTEKGKGENISRFYMELKKYFLKENSSIQIEIKRGNYLFINHLVYESLNKVLEILYTINNKFYRYPKWVLKDINKFKKKPKNVGNVLQAISKLGNSKSDLNKKIKLIKFLVKKLRPLMKK